MKIPDQIKSGGHQIKVEKVLTKEITSPGEYNDYYKLIRLRNESDIPESSISEAFLHELFECIKYQNNLEINHTHLTVFSENLFQIIRDNKLDFRDTFKH